MLKKAILSKSEFKPELAARETETDALNKKKVKIENVGT